MGRLNEHGSLATIGLLDGVETALNVTAFFGKRTRMNGITVGSRDDFVAMNALIESSGLRPVVGATFALSEVKAAFEMMERENFIGNIVVEIPPPDTAAKL